MHLCGWFEIGDIGGEVPAIVAADGSYRDASSVIDDFDPDFFASGGMEQLRGIDVQIRCR
jgi:hypothetical protein